MKKTLFPSLLVLLFIFSSCSPDFSPPSTPQDEQPVCNTWENHFEYQVTNGEITISRVLIDDDIIVIPDKIMNLPVTCIGEAACVQKNYCTQIILPSTLKSICSTAFYRCSNLKHISIPTNVCYIGENPFFRCSSLIDISVEENNQYYSSIDGILYNKSASILLAYPEGRQNDFYSVPKSVVAIDTSAFGYRTYLREIYIGRNVIYMPCENIFVFPDEITLIVESGTVASEYALMHSLNYKTGGN